MSWIRILAAIAATCTAAAAAGHDYKLGAITVEHPYARATAPGQTVGGGYLTLANAGAGDRLLSAQAAVAKSVELHSMTMDGNVMRMREVQAIALPAGATVELRPGALHLMFVGLAAPLKPGDRFPMTLQFEKAGQLTVQVLVEAPGAAAQHRAMP